MKTNKYLLISIFIFLSFFLINAADANAATYYVSPGGSNSSGNGTSASPWQTISYAAGQMQGGDTLILKDGTYSNSSQQNQIVPPSGSAGNYTTVKAENNFKAVISGRGFTWGAPAEMISKRYIQLEGLKFIDSTAYESTIYVDKSDHIKLMKISIHNGVGADTNSKYGSPVRIRDSQYVLVEDVFVSGRMRYGIIARQETGNAQYIIFRRCVVRWDMANTDQPMAAIAVYGTDGSNTINDVLIQNCVALDWNPGNYGSKNSIYGGFYTPHVTKDITIQGSIALNIHGQSTLSNYDQIFSGFMFADDKALNGNRQIYNSVSWDTKGPGIWLERGDSMTSSLDQVTVGDSDSDHREIRNSIYDKSQGQSYLTNSLLFNNAYTENTDNPSYNWYYPASQARGSNSITTNPNIKHITRTTDSGTGQNGKKRGATIEKRYGVSGTLWGEPGYDQFTNEPLWPWPYEDQIKADFSQPNPPTSGVIPSTNNPKRGFASDGNGLYGGPITLTSYIWEYLGNPCPSDVCSYGGTQPLPGDSIAPSTPADLSASPVSSSQINLSWSPSSDNTAVTNYRIYRCQGTSCQPTLLTTLGTATSYSNVGLASNATYRYQITALDAAGNESAMSSVSSAATQSSGGGSDTLIFAVIGDYGGDSIDEERVSEMIKSWNPDIIVTVGDNSYSVSGDANIGKYFSSYIGNYNGLYGAGSVVNRFFPATGNHDYGDWGIANYQNYFTLPGAGIQSTNTSGNELYYDFFAGPGNLAHFFVVDSGLNGSISSTQLSWLQSGLQSSTAAWQFVVFHHAAYSSGSNHGSDTDMQKQYEAWGADAVFQGHDHTYERIHKDDNGDGIIVPYFVTGNGGRSIYNMGSPISGSQFRLGGANGDVHGAMKVTASVNSILFEEYTVTNTSGALTYSSGGTLRDSHTITTNTYFPQSIFSTADSYLGDSTNWQPLTPSRWSVITDSGDLRYGINTTDYSNLSGSRLGEYSLIKNRTYNDFTFEAKVKSMENFSTNTSADYNIVFGYQDSNNYYYQMFSSVASNSSLFKIVGGTRQLIADSTNLSISDNNYHDIKLEKTGSTIKIYFDNTLHLTTIDSTFNGGQIGIGGYNDASLWDDITVTTPTLPSAILGDLDNNGIVNAIDWSIMNAKWNTDDPQADINGDGTVNTIDFSILNGNWTG